MAKKVVAHLYGKGFKIKGKEIIHDSKILYKGSKAYESCKDEISDLAHQTLSGFISGVCKALENKRIKPGSIRITFQILEE